VTTTQAAWYERYKVDLPEGSVGSVSLRKIEVSQRAADLERLRSMIQGTGRGVPAGTYTGLYNGGTLWMSDTPDEIADHREAMSIIKLLGGRILIMGLGLGMIVKHALACENVEHVDVVEIDPDVIALVGPHYECDRLTIHQADALSIKWPRNTRWSVVWHDIWAHISEDNLEEMTRLKRSYGARCEWQGCWAEAESRRQRQRFMW
jgi:hypothetical protein